MTAGQLDVLVIERSQIHDGLWRFGRADESPSIWGLMERNEVGGVDVKRPQGETIPWRDDRATALCLVARQPEEPRIEYDQSWRPTPPIPSRSQPRIPTRAEEHRMTLGEQAEAHRRRSTDRRVHP